MPIGESPEDISQTRGSSCAGNEGSGGGCGGSGGGLWRPDCSGVPPAGSSSLVMMGSSGSSGVGTGSLKCT